MVSARSRESYFSISTKSLLITSESTDLITRPVLRESSTRLVGPAFLESLLVIVPHVFSSSLPQDLSTLHFRASTGLLGKQVGGCARSRARKFNPRSLIHPSVGVARV